MRDWNLEFKGKHWIVLGLARSGIAVAKLLHRYGAHVIVNDKKPRQEAKEADELEKLGIPVICGGHPDDLIHDQVEAVVKNPGIPYRVGPIQQALEKGIPVITEVEIAGRLLKAPIIGITGSNGKTTTTSLVGEMFKNANLSNVVAGNIGKALVEVVEEISSDDWVIAELSSFQLKGTYQFRPQIAALLNIYPAHLDWHESMDDYVASKRKLFENQTEREVAVLNFDQTKIREIASDISSQVWWFSRKQPVEQGVYIQDDMIYAKRLNETPIPVLSVKENALRGSFNLENALAATAIGLVAGVPLEAIQKTLRTFQGVEHRLEYVQTIHGVKYYNDSKATNAQAATMALESFNEPIIWIAGGLDRGVDFKEMVSVMKKRVKALIAYGQTKEILAQRAQEAEVSQIYRVHDVKEATQVAFQIAEKGDVVLLSPACASWDQYTSFEERGSIFKQAVHSLQI